MFEKKSWWHSWEMTIDSDWITTIGLALILIACGAMLTSEIRHFISGTVTGRFPLPNLVNVLIPLCYFLGAFQLRISKLVRIAFLLLGIDFAGRLAMGYLRASIHLHEAATIGSVLRQAALTLVLVAILLWFRSVLRVTRETKFLSNSQQTRT